jgi:glycosyltransferase involved in cell wall biosynthesis
VYNGERYIRQAIDGVLAQTYTQWELIVVDDGSTDGTPEILRSYGDPRIRIVNGSHHGLPQALTEGFRHARGEFWTWTSDDNVLLPPMLETLVKQLDSRPDVDMVYSDEEIIGPSGEILLGTDFWFQDPPGSGTVRFPIDPSRLNWEHCNFVGACFLYRNYVGRIIGPYGAELFGFEDYDYWMRINALFRMAHTGRIAPLYRYRLHPESLTSRHKEMQIYEKVAGHIELDRRRRELYLQPFDILFDGDHPWHPALQRGWHPFLGVSDKRILVHGDQIQFADGSSWQVGHDVLARNPEALLYPVLARANSIAGSRVQ